MVPHIDGGTEVEGVRECGRGLGGKKWRNLRNAEFLFYSLPYITRVIKSRRMELARHVARVDEKDGADGFYVGKAEEERPFGRTWRRWENNFKKELREIERLGMRRIDVAQDKEKWRAFIDTIMNNNIKKQAEATKTVY